jgi:hypothetical protein
MGSVVVVVDDVAAVVADVAGLRIEIVPVQLLRPSQLCKAGWVRAVGWRGGSANEGSPAG